ncbi:hypothetical protein [Pseudomonas sp. McL0111]|uniref:hypothetical protein n=1 Tax=Pseudomonas sp. McL0111 TaxID=3457357 RepID=UPI00403EB67D
MFTFKTLLQTALVGLALSSTANVLAGEAFGKPYTAVGPVSAEQAQVVVYRPAAPHATNGAANVYVDREFHAALLPGGFSTLCVAAGVHSLGAALNGAPSYKGKETNAMWFTLAAGNTYFLRVGEDANMAPQFVKRDGAERELAGMRQQIQALSRASSVKACDYSQTGTSISQ